MYTKALCLIVAVAFVAIAADSAAVKGRQEIASVSRFQAPAKSAPRLTQAAPRPLLSKASPPPPPPPPPAVSAPEFQAPEPQQQEQETDSEGASAQDAASLARLPAAPSESSEEPTGAAEPYSFKYDVESSDQATSGSSSRDEQMDTSGKVTGFYTLKGEDGRDRRVDYIADASGFRAVVSTNELGTAAKNSADVEWQAQSPSDGQLRAAESATEAARARAPTQARQLSASKPSSPWAAQQQADRFASASASKASIAAQQQESFEQIRQTDINSRARKSRHVQFYTI